jgi:outer membrane protein TolC
MSQHNFRRKLPAWIAALLTVALFCPTVPPARAQPWNAAPARTLDLADCLQLALQRQPRLAAARADLALAEGSLRTLDALKLLGLVDAEIPIRRRQVVLGLAAATAAVDQVECETVYAVTRTYFTVLYAREQESVARAVVDRLTAVHQVAQDQLKAGARDISDTDVQRAKVYLRLAQVKRIEATVGIQRALEALREAIGLGCDVPLDVPPGHLPNPAARPQGDNVVASALARRAELIRAGIFAEVVCLEADAQQTSFHPRKETFAAGTDLHAVPVPQGVKNTEYRPGGILPEMPTMLFGSRADRAKQAQTLHARAVDLVQVTHNLIVLEAKDAFLRWQEAAQQVPAARDAADTGDQLANSQTKDFIASLKVRVDEVINARVLASQARAQYNEYLYKQILALADLERVTAGGFCAGLVEATAAAPMAPGKKSGGK